MTEASHSRATELPRHDTAARAKLEGRPVAIQAALDAFEDGDEDACSHFLYVAATPSEVEAHAEAFAHKMAITAASFLLRYRTQRPDFLASNSDPVSPISPPLTGCGENGERASGTFANGRKSSFGESEERGKSHSAEPITATPFCDLNIPFLPRDAYLFRDILIRGNVTLLAGTPGSGKSTFAHFIAAGLARRGRVLGSGPGKPLVTLYFDAESHPALACEKARAACEGEATRNLRLLSSNAFSGNNAALIACIREHRAQLLVIDTLTRALPLENENDAAEARGRVVRLQRIAREADIAILALCHQPKASNRSPVHNVLGSVETSAGVDVVVLAKSCGRNQENFDLEIAKHRIVTPTDVKLRLRKVGGGIFTITGDAPSPVRTDKHPFAAAIEAFAAKHGQITRPQRLEIATQQGLSIKTADRIRRKLVDEGILRKVGYGVYSIADDSNADTPGTRETTERADNE